MERKWYIRKKTNKYHTSIFLSIILLTILTIIAFSLTLYLNFENIALSFEYTFIKDNQSQVLNSIDTMRASAKSLSLQMYFDSDIQHLLYSSNVSPIETVAGYNRMCSYRDTSPLIHSVYVYNNYAQSFYTTMNEPQNENKQTFFDKEIISIIDGNLYRNVPMIPRRIFDPNKAYDKDSLSDVYTIVFTGSSADDDKPKSLIIMNISEEWLMNSIKTLEANDGSSAFIINGKGELMTTAGESTMLHDMSQQKYIQKILSMKNASGYFTDTVDNRKSFITYIPLNMMDWTFVSVTPYSNILSKISRVKVTSVVIVSFALIVGFILSILVSRKLYKPIDTVLGKLNHLEAEKKNYLYAYKQDLLKSALCGKLDEDGETIRGKFRELDVRLDDNGRYALFLIKIDHFLDFRNNYNLKDRGLLKFGIMSMASDICSTSFRNETVEMEDNLVAVVADIGPAAHGEPDMLEELAAKIQKSVQESLSISLSITIGSAAGPLQELAPACSEAMEVSMYRMFHGYKSILNAGTARHTGSFSAYEYPKSKEKMLVDAIMLGKGGDMRDLYLDIISGTLNYPFNVFQTVTYRLAVAINSTIETVCECNHIPAFYNFDTFVNDLRNMETLGEVNNLFFDVFERIVEQLNRRNASKYDNLLKTVTEIINSKYMDPNLSLESIADKVDMSPLYLGRLFRKMALKSVAEYINETRIGKARELLVSTDDTMNDIMEKTGLVGCGYFYTLFKKLNGMTPNEYRQAHSKASAD